MTLPNVGPLTFSAIRGEFGGGTPMIWSQYYAGGAHVPSGTSGVNGAVPSAGALAMSKFLGTTAFTPFTDTFSNGQAGSIAVPSGATSVTIYAFGGGGGGGNWDGSNVGGGGGSGARVILTIAVAGGQTINYNAPVRATGQANGFSSTVSAVVSGGAIAITSGGGFGGGAGSSFGSGALTATGGNVANNLGSNGTSGGTGGASPGGGGGGLAGCGGQTGGDPGGGGGGDTCGNGPGDGGYGQIELHWS